MQQLKVEHKEKTTTTNQVVEAKDRRIAKSMVVAMSCEITKLAQERETYKVQSESDVNKYYIVKFMDGTPVFCSCPDFLNRVKTNPFHICKHARAIVLAENYGLVTRQNSHSPPAKFEEARVKPKSYKDDDYSF